MERFRSHAIRVACCLLLLTGCRVAGTVRPTVKIGLVAPFEGRYRYVGYDVIYAVRLALREANTAGGVGGYSPSTGSGYNVELVAYDDGADPAMAAEQARKLSADPEVVAVIGHFREETTTAALSAYAEAGIPLVAPAVLDPALIQGETMAYRLGPAAGTVASELLQHLKGLGLDHAALVTEGGSLGVALQRGAQQYGLQVSPVVSPENTGWLDEVVFCDADPMTAGEVAAALREAGWEGAFLGGPELAATDFVAVAGQAAEGAVFVTPWLFPADVPSSANFVAAYRAVSHDVPPPGPLALPAYEATWVLLEALERDIAVHGEPTREGVGAALMATRREGLLGVITFNADRNWDDAPLYWYQIGAEGTARLAVTRP